MSVFGGASDGGASAQEAVRQQTVTNNERQIDKQFSGFTPDFYKQAGDDYTKSVLPGVMNDYRTTKNNLTYSLARSGLLKSGAAVQRNNSLEGQLSTNETQIANNAQDRSNQLQQNVNNQKSQLYAQAIGGADPTAINSEAQGAVSQLRAPSAIQPLGNLFSSWADQYLNTQSAQAYQQPNIWNELSNANYGTF